jgi:hypothetical protein
MSQTPPFRYNHDLPQWQCPLATRDKLKRHYFTKVCHIKIVYSRSALNPLTFRGHPSGAANQAQVLRGEGVTVNTGSLGEFMVDLAEYGWFPRQLPSEEAAGMTPPIDSDTEQ